MRKQVAARQLISGTNQDSLRDLDAVFQHDPSNRRLDLRGDVFIERFQPIVCRSRNPLHPHVRPIVEADDVHQQRQPSVLGLQMSGDEERGMGFAGDRPWIAVGARVAQHLGVAVDADPVGPDRGQPFDDDVGDGGYGALARGVAGFVVEDRDGDDRTLRSGATRAPPTNRRQRRSATPPLSDKQRAETERRAIVRRSWFAAVAPSLLWRARRFVLVPRSPFRRTRTSDVNWRTFRFPRRPPPSRRRRFGAPGAR